MATKFKNSNENYNIWCLRILNKIQNHSKST